MRVINKRWNKVKKTCIKEKRLKQQLRTRIVLKCVL